VTGLQAALEFLATGRRDKSLRRELEQFADAVTYDDLVSLARRRGLVFTAEELGRAYAIDWRLRQAHYGVR
jgi:hypothetical protein